MAVETVSGKSSHPLSYALHIALTFSINISSLSLLLYIPGFNKAQYSDSLICQGFFGYFLIFFDAEGSPVADFFYLYAKRPALPANPDPLTATRYTLFLLLSIRIST